MQPKRNCERSYLSGGQGGRLPRDWVAALIDLLQHEPAMVRVVVADTRGSTPQERGAVMLVGGNLSVGTIGGGRLEWEAIAAARALLGDTRCAGRLHKSVLGPDLGQCCGGVVSTWMDRFTPADLALLHAAAAAAATGPTVLVSTLSEHHVERQLLSASGDVEPPSADLSTVVRADGARRLVLRERLDRNFCAVWLYGAGHVGRAVARILVDLPVSMTWIDSRPELGAIAGVRHEPDPVSSVSQAPAGAYILVMTHSHQLDFALCHAALRRGDFSWLGLIGSQSKSARFRSRLRRLGMDAGVVARLVCPIGIEGITGKWPATIALAVAAQIMREVSTAAARSPAGIALGLAACAQETCCTCAHAGTGVAS